MAAVSHLDLIVNGRGAEPSGNAHASFAPHNVFPCRGEDRWVAIAITNDAQWASLVQAVGAADWAADESLATAAGRKAREAELEARIGQWTRQYTPHQAMRLLQRAGVPAGAVQNGEDLYFDPHLRERGYTVTVDQPFLGPAVEPGLTMTFENATPPGPRGAAYLGEANDYVFKELLGLADAEVAALKEERALV
jgi:crotonobetainyl-CoA:carnitine CoA-transferase CaiB-like acyl-CoA transferase